ncbi:MAG: hypothetical protein JNL66_04120 [Alphaproteobacteria bacterium]|nr:hypothetical protein [Alphaproteobacteria bacterium]
MASRSSPRPLEETLIAGIKPADAIRLAEAAVRKPSINEATPDQLGRRPKAERLHILQAIGKALPDRLGMEHATALRKLVNGFCSVETMVDWLRHAPMSLRDHYQLCAERYAAANPPLPAHPRQGYWLDFKAKGRGPHRFGGAQSIPGAICNRCDKPFLHFMSLATADERLQLPRHIDSLPLLYCWRCQGTGKRFVYRVSGKNAVDVLIYAPFNPREKPIDDSDDFPYPDYPASFPEKRVDLAPVPPRIAAVLRLLNGERYGTLIDEHDLKRTDKLALPCHQVGGEPYLIQYPPGDPIACPRCKKDMKLLATLCDNPLGPAIDASYDRAAKKGVTFTGNAYVQLLFHACAACLTVDVRNVVD